MVDLGGSHTAPLFLHTDSSGTPLLYPLHHVCNTPCPHRATQPLAGSPVTLGVSHGEGPLSAGLGGSPAPGMPGMTLLRSILRQGASSGMVQSETQDTTMSLGGWCFAAMET